MSELSEIKEILIKQEKKLDKVVFAIYGDESAKVKGMADTLSEHEKYINGDRKFKWVVGSTFLASSGGLWAYVKSSLGI